MNAIAKIKADVEVSDPPVTAPHVLVAINRVMEEIGREGISKDRKNNAQGYNFRGIDDVYNALAPILARHRLIIKPRGLGRTCEERQSKSGGAMFYVNVAMEFDLLSAIDGSRETAGPFYGEAMDSADKATNKAQSAAFKYFAMQQFVIPTEGDNDADAHTHEIEVRKPLWVVSAKSAIEGLNTEDECGAWYKNNLAMLKDQPKAERDEVLAYLKHRKTSLAPLPTTIEAAKAEEARFRRDGSGRVAGGGAGEVSPFDALQGDTIPF